MIWNMKTGNGNKNKDAKMHRESSGIEFMYTSCNAQICFQLVK